MDTGKAFSSSNHSLVEAGHAIHELVEDYIAKFSTFSASYDSFLSVTIDSQPTLCNYIDPKVTHAPVKIL